MYRQACGGSETRWRGGRYSRRLQWRIREEGVSGWWGVVYVCPWRNIKKKRTKELKFSCSDKKSLKRRRFFIPTIPLFLFLACLSVDMTDSTDPDRDQHPGERGSCSHSTLDTELAHVPHPKLLRFFD